jgi:hypothetical protein
MATLQGPPFNLEYGAAVLVKVIAFNSVGDGPPSPVGGNAVSATMPGPPMMFTRSDLFTTTSQISFAWENGDFDGGSPIIDYQGLSDQGIGIYQVIAIGVVTKSFTTTASQPIQAGQVYTFRVQSRNAIGYSSESADFAVLAANRPDKLDPPTLTPELADQIVVVDWEAPIGQMNQFGAVITDYLVYVR